MESSTPKSKGAEAFSDFVRSPSTRDRISGVEEHDETRGSIAIIEAPDNKAQLRCFLLHPDLLVRQKSTASSTGVLLIHNLSGEISK